MSDWIDNSSLASAGGLAWTWKCNRNGVAEDCKAYKKGKCGYDATTSPSAPPYSDNNDACRFGSFNSVQLVSGVLHWKCGTGDSAKHVGNFFSNSPGDGNVVAVDYYGPKTGGVDCQCTPVYEYDCVGGNYVGSCDNNCGGTMTQQMQAIKKDTTCFTNESTFISKDEYYTATGKHCVDKTIQCAPCGTQDQDGGVYHESN